MFKTLFGLYQLIHHWKHVTLVSVFGYSSTCHHSPSCATYTHRAVAQDGTITGLLKGIWRILTCW